jgi:hypothetical protein
MAKKPKIDPGSMTMHEKLCWELNRAVKRGWRVVINECRGEVFVTAERGAVTVSADAKNTFEALRGMLLDMPEHDPFS